MISSLFGKCSDFMGRCTPRVLFSLSETEKPMIMASNVSNLEVSQTNLSTESHRTPSINGTD